ncbi:MAG TPA: YitT family protein [Candidatus Scatomorpha intestinavium]|uniref:YitT family protein n=1 Tax=Candidatus Scatomorpha intestinavium TaxID=2840922 RepID=A0A9D0ZD16_9FIRM|nr:YitT family protein [Candidatus Scatomorpha intestinavium]
MLPKRTVTEYVKEYALIILGSAIYGVGFEFFFYPNEVLAGGLTGVAMIINMLTDLPVGVMNIVMNIPLFIAAWRRFGLGFVIGSFTGMAASSVFIDLFSLLHWEATDNILLAAIFGGLLNGLGLGIIYRAGVTTGGVDIVVKFLRIKYQYLNFGTLMLILDVAILAVYALIFNTLEAAMYSTIAMFVVSRAIDVVLYGLSASKVCYIISDESDKLKNTITHQLGRGVTLLHGEGAYTGKAKNVILCVIKKTQITQVRRIVKTVDVHAFLIVTDARDVFGNGFENIESEN